MLSVKGIALVVHVILVKPNTAQKLDGMNLIIHLKVQNHRNTFDATSSTVLHGLSFQMLLKMLRAGMNEENHILLSGNLILTNKRTLED